jgi:siroheme synthase
MDAGWNPDTPVALIAGASRRDEDVRCTTLSALAIEDASSDEPESAPTTIVIGDVARVRQQLLARQAATDLPAWGEAERIEVSHG